MLILLNLFLAGLGFLGLYAALWLLLGRPGI